MAKSEIPSRKFHSTNFWKGFLAYLGWALLMAAISSSSVALIFWIFIHYGVGF